MQREPGRGRVGVEGGIGRWRATDVHVTERDVMVLLTNSDPDQIRFPQESGTDGGGNSRSGRSML
ncbi:hypothetical protein D7U93_00740 [Stenotrophomonas maltophilia]|mgnify:FL=1|nr:hypothetical protein XY58_18955 [Stenotrophomonas maltophilia]MBA0254271.1 hypothetical protein [Stenotrophomonas maltophilia]MBA0378036.1 hypothetical protein [Stenotrophomonas maltophilia]MBA0406609.1 hypothetical protein [Stenotrophomonas maltophilia]MBA0424102.1 hypothetical protein [Stenotrophomonas maltophilia]